VSNFEFVFSLLSILLGLALAAVLGGFARVLKMRPRIRIGWGTGLLATWVTTETIIFWQVIWQVRDALPARPQPLFAGFIITALYYFAAASVFPDDLAGRADLDDFFMQEKAKVIGALIAALALSLLLWWAYLGSRIWNIVEWYDVVAMALILGLGPVALLARRRKVAIAVLAILVVSDLMDPIWALVLPK
jgi:hypothetical protein